jgi:hypothetical protein
MPSSSEFSFFLIISLTFHGYSEYLVGGLSSDVALQAAFFTVVTSAIASSMCFAVLSGMLSRKFSSIWVLNASQYFWLLCSFDGFWRVIIRILIVTYIGVWSYAISRFILMYKELFEIPLKKISLVDLEFCLCLLANKLVRPWIVFLIAFLVWFGIARDLYD